MARPACGPLATVKLWVKRTTEVSEVAGAPNHTPPAYNSAAIAAALATTADTEKPSDDASPAKTSATPPHSKTSEPIRALLIQIDRGGAIIRTRCPKSDLDHKPLVLS